MSLELDGGLNYNDEHHWFWAAVIGEPPLERLRVLHQAALDFLKWEGGASPDKVIEALEQRQADLLVYAREIHGAKKGSALGVQLMTIDEYRAEE